MRCISNDDFWGAALSGEQASHYSQGIAALNAESTEITAAEVQRRLDMLLGLRLDVARLHHCFNSVAIRDYHIQMVSLMHSVYGATYLFSDTCPPEPARAEFHRRIEALGKSFAQQKKCHPSYNGFVCYCDEHSPSQGNGSVGTARG